jgi:hypothetical protein
MPLGADGEPVITADSRVQPLDWSAEWAGEDPLAAEHAARTALRDAAGRLSQAELDASTAALHDAVVAALRAYGGYTGAVRVALGDPQLRGSVPVAPRTGNPLGPPRFAWPLVVVPVAHVGVLRGGKVLQPGLSVAVPGPGRLRLVDLREHLVQEGSARAWFSVTDAAALVASGVEDPARAVAERLPMAATRGDDAQARAALSEALAPLGLRVDRISLDRGASAPATPALEGRRL